MIKVNNVDCLFCNRRGSCVTDPERIITVDNLIVRPLYCSACKKKWKDFYGATNAASPVLSIQRTKDKPCDKPNAR